MSQQNYNRVYLQLALTGLSPRSWSGLLQMYWTGSDQQVIILELWASNLKSYMGFSLCCVMRHFQVHIFDSNVL